MLPHPPQAVLLDIALFFPSLFGLLPLDPGLKQALAEPCSDAIWAALCAAVLYSVAWNLAKGSCPNKLPLIGDTVYRQIGGRPEDDE